MKTPDYSDLLKKHYIYHTAENDGGYDCYDFEIDIQERFGHHLESIRRNHSSQAVFNDNAESVIESMKEKVKETDSPVEGDIIVFFDAKGRLVHIGTYLGNDRFIHCDTRGVEVLRLSSYFLRKWKAYTWLK